MNQRLIYVTIIISVFAVMALFFSVRAFATGTAIENGDVNGDRVINIADSVYLLGFLFSSGPAPVPIVSPTQLEYFSVGIAPASDVIVPDTASVSWDIEYEDPFGLWDSVAPATLLLPPGTWLIGWSIQTVSGGSDLSLYVNDERIIWNRSQNDGRNDRVAVVIIPDAPSPTMISLRVSSDGTPEPVIIQAQPGGIPADDRFHEFWGKRLD